MKTTINHCNLNKNNYDNHNLITLVGNHNLIIMKKHNMKCKNPPKNEKYEEIKVEDLKK